MRKIGFIIILTALITSCSLSNSSSLIRSDLFGKPLTNDDFKIIFGRKTYEVFMTKSVLLKSIPNIVGKYDKEWTWSVLNEGSAMDGFPNYEYRNRNVRYVYFLEAKEVVNDYLAIFNNSMTIRGIKIGDSADKVLKAYGESFFKNEQRQGFRATKTGLVYRFYNYQTQPNEKYPFFDYISFEINKGIVKGIHYWKKANDSM